MSKNFYIISDVDSTFEAKKAGDFDRFEESVNGLR